MQQLHCVYSRFVENGYRPHSKALDTFVQRTAELAGCNECGKSCCDKLLDFVDYFCGWLEYLAKLEGGEWMYITKKTWQIRVIYWLAIVIFYLIYPFLRLKELIFGSG